jgi:hypothetical protein
VLKHKVADDDESGFTPHGWRAEVNSVMVRLKLSVHGARAAAIGPSGIPGETQLVKVSGHWLFNSYPSSVQA